MIGDGNQVIVSSSSSTENNNCSNVQLVLNNPNDVELFLNYVEFVSLFLSHDLALNVNIVCKHNNINDRKGTDNLKELYPYFDWYGIY